MMALMDIGFREILIILLVVLILFGGKKLPELARGLGKGMRTFKDELKGIKSDIDISSEDKELQSGTTNDTDKTGSQEPPKNA